MVGKSTKDPSFPGLKRSAAAAQYEERQKDELEALEAIYGPDFVQHKALHGAWKKSEPSFDIRIKAASDDEFAVTLGVVLTATYPKSVPLLKLKDHGTVRESALFKIHKYIETRSKALASEETEMVQELVEGIRDLLEDAAEAKGQGLEQPSLEDERAAHEALVSKMAQDEREKAERKKLEDARDEERALAALVDQERERQRTKAKESRNKNKSNMSPELAARDHDQAAELILLDEPCDLTDGAGTVVFKTVTGKQLYGAGPIAAVYRVRPVLSEEQDRISLALKQTELLSKGKDAVEVLKQIQSLEALLQSLKKLRQQKLHRHVLEILDFKIDRVSTESGSTTWTVSVLTLFAERGSLEELLGLSGHLDVARVRAWTRDLLDALEYLHTHGIVHQDIHPGNVLLVRESSGDITPKLADAAYQRELHNIYTKTQALPPPKAAKSAYWFPPEIAGHPRPQYTRKTDVWDFGVMFLQMTFGLDVLQKYRSPKDLMDSLSLSEPLDELVSKLFMADPRKRPRAFDLSSSQFLATDAPIMDDDSSAIAGSLVSLPQALPTRLRHDSMTRGASTSRFQENFVEEARLGKGGFGEVVKARKKLDGQIYAIKKISITQGSRESLTVTDILKEVRLLSQLSHPAVVRYYDAWLEEVAEFPDAGGESSTGAFSSEYSDDDMNIEFTNGLDFVSSGGNLDIVFESEESGNEDEADEGDDSSDDEAVVSSNPDDDAEPAEGGAPNHRRMRRGSQRPSRRVMYISMEYCEKRVRREFCSKSVQHS